MARLQDLTREELLAVVSAQGAVIQEQATRIEALTGQVAELTQRLGQNSQNSSLPPSSDRFGKPKRDRRKPSTRRPGKQPGAPGSTLELVGDPEEVVEHVPDACVGWVPTWPGRCRRGRWCGRSATSPRSRCGSSSTGCTSGPVAVGR